MALDRRIQTSAFAIGVDLFLTILRISLASITASLALLADAFHSVTDLMVSVALMIGILFRIHQEKKGTEKGEVRARYLDSAIAIAVALLILYLPFEILAQSREQLGQNSIDVKNIWIAIPGMLVIISCLLFIARLKRWVGQQTGTLTLEADGHHSLVDLYTSIAVLCSLVGMAIGINIDPYVALIIVIMIILSGSQLLLSGLRQLFVGDEYRELSLREILVMLTRYLPFSSVGLSSCKRFMTSLWQKRYHLSATLVAGYFCTGLTTIPIGYTGIKYRLSDPIETHLAPGLHYALPAPLGSIKRLITSDIRSVTVGSKPASQVRAVGANLWLENRGRNSRNDDTSYVLTGDETLLFVDATVMYRIDDPVAAYQQINDTDSLVSLFANNILGQQIAQNRYEDINEESSLNLSQNLHTELNKRLQQTNVPITILNTNINRIQPPATLVSKYRNVLNAYQLSQDLVNQSIASRLYDLPIARAEQTLRLGKIAAESSERHLSAHGEVLQATERAQAYIDNPESYAFELWWNTVLESLGGKAFSVVHPDIDNKDLRIWDLTTSVN
ncbi:hypothetical protein BCU68_16210 [Vibrio sp. 10N.286.49.B3]|uniref:cation transporter n=1 Tax=Vibrio sp. 10N.286.49.B3 TaxID=1880855 RepID=UPI000C867585|nr:cation transporter [Vibrio sp. 10N.286.49.B3]PMH40602.1 hypothetical protein BCU68_16210 [Vibrio sp. 10N.286.49.B3]